MIAFWKLVWLLIAVQMVIGLLITHLYYDGPSVTGEDGTTVADDHEEGSLHG